MSFGQVEGYVVDTCVLLPQPLESSIKSCSNFLKENSNRCSLTSSIKKEAFKLIEDAHDLIIEHFHAHLKPFFERRGMKEITNRDGRIMAEFFAEQKTQLKIISHVRSNVPNEYISAIENYLADQIHSLPIGKKIPVDVFLASAATQLAIAKHALEAPFEGLRCEEISPNDELKAVVAVGAKIRNPDDVTHLCSALKYQFHKNKWIIFVTNDQNEILSREKELWEMFLRCTSPQWAPDYYSDLTRNKAPLGWAKELKNASPKQKDILEAI